MRELVVRKAQPPQRSALFEAIESRDRIVVRAQLAQASVTPAAKQQITAAAGAAATMTEQLDAYEVAAACDTMRGFLDVRAAH